LLDFIFHLLRDRRLTSPDATTDFSRRARRLMFKIMFTNPVIPRSLIVTGVKVPAKRDYIGGGAFGSVCKGELRGKIVALKVLYRTGASVVSPSCACSVLSLTFILIGVLSRGIDVGNAQARVRTAIPGNLSTTRGNVLRLTLHGEWHAGPMAEECKTICYRDTESCMAFSSVLH